MISVKKKKKSTFRIIAAQPLEGMGFRSSSTIWSGEGPVKN
jgi:hypothetical protein